MMEVLIVGRQEVGVTVDGTQLEIDPQLDGVTVEMLMLEMQELGNTVSGVQLDTDWQLDGVIVEMLTLELQEPGVMVTGVQDRHDAGVTVEMLTLKKHEVGNTVVGVQIWLVVTVESEQRVDGQVVGITVVGEQEEEQRPVIVEMVVL